MGRQPREASGRRYVPLQTEVLPEQRAEILRIAESRGGASIGSVVREAVQFYLDRRQSPDTSEPTLAIAG